MATRAPLAIAMTFSVALLASGCGGDEDADTSRTDATSESAPADTAPTGTAAVETTEDVDIGGRSLALKCWGEAVDGEPTILLLSGQGPTLSSWDLFASGLAGEGHHLCAYDRAGVGGSEVPPEDVRTTTDQVDDLVALLDGAEAELNEPLVVVAHSLGSLPAIGLVDRAPERVAGVVLVDPWQPRVGETLLAALPPEKSGESQALAQERLFLDGFRNDPTQNGEHLLVSACDDEAIAQLDRPGPLFGDRPVVVLQAPFPPRPPGLPRSYDEAARAAWTTGNEELSSESTNGAVIKVEDTGHDIHVDQPGAVVDAILDVLAG